MEFRNQFEVDFDGLIETLPPVVALSDTVISQGDISCFIGICGFEPRCYAAPELAAKLGYKAGNVICVHYHNQAMDEANEQHVPRLYDAWKVILRDGSPARLDYDDHDLEQDFGKCLIDALSEAGVDLSSSRTTIAFDISVGTSRLLLEGLYALLNTKCKLILLYSESINYRPSYLEYKQFLENEKESNNMPAPEFLAYGVDKVEVLRSIPGQIADARPTFLVLFPSFTPIRVMPVIEELSPSRVQWLFGVPHLIRNRWRVDAQRDLHKALVEDMHRHCYVSTFDYRETLDVLESIYRRRRNEYSILICSLGSKLQKVGQALFHILRPEVGAVVSIPRAWNPDRFTDDVPRAVYSIDFGDCTDLRERMRLTRTLRL